MNEGRRAGWVLGGVIPLVACAHETRKPGDYRPSIEVSTEEARTIDATEATSSGFGADRHRRCALWTRVRGEATPDQRGVRAYAGERIAQSCDSDSEARLRSAEEALASAEREPAVATAASALVALDAYARSVVPTENATLAELLRRARPVLDRLRSEGTCAQHRDVAWLDYRTGNRATARSTMLGPVRACLGVREASALLDEAADASSRPACEEAVALAPEVWPRATSRDEQVQLLDRVARCSDAFTARRNFAFVPVDVLADYQALRRDRDVKFAREQLRRETQRLAHEATDRCEEHCLTMYAEHGGVCTSSCRGDTICFNNCVRLGEDCRRQCR